MTAIIIVILVISFAYLLAFSCCKAAARGDAAYERLYQKQQADRGGDSQ